EPAPAGHDRLAVLCGHVGTGEQEVVAAPGGDALDDAYTGQHVAGPDRSVVREALVTVYHPAEVQAEIRVLDQLPYSGVGHHDRERRRGDHVWVPELAGRLRVHVGLVPGADGLAELADLLPAHPVRRRRRVAVARERRVQRHG